MLTHFRYTRSVLGREIFFFFLLPPSSPPFEKLWNVDSLHEVIVIHVNT